MWSVCVPRTDPSGWSLSIYDDLHIPSVTTQLTYITDHITNKTNTRKIIIFKPILLKVIHQIINLIKSFLENRIIYIKKFLTRAFQPEPLKSACTKVHASPTRFSLFINNMSKHQNTSIALFTYLTLFYAWSSTINSATNKLPILINLVYIKWNNQEICFNNVHRR